MTVCINPEFVKIFIVDIVIFQKLQSRGLWRSVGVAFEHRSQRDILKVGKEDLSFANCCFAGVSLFLHWVKDQVCQFDMLICFLLKLVFVMVRAWGVFDILCHDGFWWGCRSFGNSGWNEFGKWSWTSTIRICFVHWCWGKTTNGFEKSLPCLAWGQLWWLRFGRTAWVHGGTLRVVFWVWSDHCWWCEEEFGVTLVVRRE